MKRTSPEPPLAARLLEWYDGVARDLPWRKTRDPYAVWVSEAMLQQTQVAAALPYYERWMERFPTAQHLARASEQDALALWQGLGYYTRCRRLLQGVRLAVEHGFPTTEREWRSLPGIGAYTAAALASLCNNEPAAVVDGNVARVFARHAACEDTRGKLVSQAREWAQGHLDHSRPGDFNQAMMELGATVCRPRNPECPACPLRSDCLARAGNRVSELPRPAATLAPIEVSLVVLVPLAQGRVGVRPVSHPSWWKGMHEFPTAPKLEDLTEFTQGCAAEPMASFRHTVTRHRLSFEVFQVAVGEPKPDLQWHPVAALSSIPLPAPYRKIAQALAGSRSDT